MITDTNSKGGLKCPKCAGGSVGFSIYSGTCLQCNAAWGWGDPNLKATPMSNLLLTRLIREDKGSNQGMGYFLAPSDSRDEEDEIISRKTVAEKVAYVESCRDAIQAAKFLMLHSDLPKYLGRLVDEKEPILVGVSSRDERRISAASYRNLTGAMILPDGIRIVQTEASEPGKGALEKEIQRTRDLGVLCHPKSMMSRREIHSVMLSLWSDSSNDIHICFVSWGSYPRSVVISKEKLLSPMVWDFFEEISKSMETFELSPSFNRSPAVMAIVSAMSQPIVWTAVTTGMGNQGSISSALPRALYVATREESIVTASVSVGLDNKRDAGFAQEFASVFEMLPIGNSTVTREIRFKGNTAEECVENLRDKHSKSHPTEISMLLEWGPMGNGWSRLFDIRTSWIWKNSKVYSWMSKNFPSIVK